MMNIGNLIFIDPSHEENRTLYGQILGLKTDSNDVARPLSSSLLEMEIILNPKERQFSSILEGKISNTVIIDRDQGEMNGCDCFLRARFSPMRFVMIEQLWMEIMDYFFQGVIGSEVTGGQKSEATLDQRRTETPQSPIKATVLLPGSEADGISFTRFDIVLDSPAILMPVTYSSPEFVRLELSKICLNNEYKGSVVSDTAYAVDNSVRDRMQWFNNCTVSLDKLRLFSWSGHELGKEPVICTVSLCWPTGPLATSITPKWRVECKFESLDISLRRSDYSLLQNIIAYNIGEPSRYMDEWAMLQNLSPEALNDLMENIIVHYGYDKKDVAPSTYDMNMTIPSLKFNLIEADKISSSPIAIARCFDLTWQMRKDSDLVVKQKVTCDIDLVTPNANSDVGKLLSISKYDKDFDKDKDDQDCFLPGLTYSSQTMPNRDNVKKIEIVDACIHLIVPAWARFTAFFQSLAPPIMLNERDIGSSIQVGDRWYRIGDGGNSPLKQTAESVTEGTDRFSWIKANSLKPFHTAQQRNSSGLSAGRHSPTLQIRILLVWPRIVLSSVAVDGPPTQVVLQMHHLDFLQSNCGKESSMTRSLFLHDVEVYTSSEKKQTKAVSDDGQNSLIRPWSVAAMASSCNGESVGNCNKHSYRLSGDVLRARAAYSDIAIAIDVVLSVLHSAKEEKKGAPQELPTTPIYSSGSYDSCDSYFSETCSEIDDGVFCTKPAHIDYDVQFDGFELKVADDRYVCQW
jgi:hypothetical protein